MKRIVITGAKGLIGWHAHARLHAANCAAMFKGEPAPFEIVALDHTAFRDDATLQAAVRSAEAVLHFAGVNRAPDDQVEVANPAIASQLADACNTAGVTPHIVYANSTHAANDTPYGRSKRIAGEVLSQVGGSYTDMVLPHIFGECARPRYNNVTATFIEAVIAGKTPDINPEGSVSLLHAGRAVQTALDAVLQGTVGTIKPDARTIAVSELFGLLQQFHAYYQSNIYPDFGDAFTVSLFNSYRAALYPREFPRTLKLNSDKRGTLFEAVKGGGGGQTFLSTSKPGVTRGNHFHLNKVERFLVVQGEAVIRIRKVLSDEVWEYRVSGDTPAPVDMPTLHTHSIENIGGTELLTLFWTNDLFDPTNSDTFADEVLV
ncbi:polysaccharide biosynthesis C-terminal domain-containing protein [Sulfitobacter pontiacus]|uniref:polysaccharide biosynthesis C-terminal domain-containing protein n=1 Tax=Sulfitobacter pontiacus TaxID=60137 RepID=UPI001052DA47|nr:NAD-dependent epimerase/dehydratase family protein [Sulfitobacter pontiacus]GLO80054.1 epimerase [Sulfitobacter pontiacus]